jgi:hypothetical protein
MDKKTEERLTRALKNYQEVTKGQESEIGDKDFAHILDGYQSEKELMDEAKTLKQKKDLKANIGLGEQDPRYDNLQNDLNDYVLKLRNDINSKQTGDDPFAGLVSEEIDHNKKQNEISELSNKKQALEQFQSGLKTIASKIYAKESGIAEVHSEASNSINSGEARNSYGASPVSVENNEDLGIDILQTESPSAGSNSPGTEQSPSASDISTNEEFELVREESKTELDAEAEYKLDGSAKIKDLLPDESLKLPMKEMSDYYSKNENINQAIQTVTSNADASNEIENFRNFKDSLAELKLTLNQEFEQQPEIRKQGESLADRPLQKTEQIARNMDPEKRSDLMNDRPLHIARDRVEVGQYSEIKASINSALKSKKFKDKAKNSYERSLSDLDAILEKHNPSEKDVDKVNNLSKQIGKDKTKFGKETSQKLQSDLTELGSDIKNERIRDVKVDKDNKVKVGDIIDKIHEDSFGLINSSLKSDSKLLNSKENKDLLANDIEHTRSSMKSGQASGLAHEAKIEVNRSLDKIENALDIGKHRGVGK